MAQVSGVAVAGGEPRHDGVLPLAGALGEGDGREHGAEEEREDQGAEQGEGDHPGHRLEEPAFDGLQGEDGQIGGDDHAAGEEDGALDLVGGLANLLRGGHVLRGGCGRGGGRCFRP